MKKMKTMILIIITVFLLNGTVISAFAEEQQSNTSDRYVDIENSMAYYHVQARYMIDNSIMSGVDNTHFAPYSYMTREMLVTTLGRIAENSGKSIVEEEVSFNDVKKGSWYAKYVAWASRSGIVTGYSNTHFGIGKQIKREEAITMIMRFSSYMGYTFDRDVIDVKEFLDVDKISSWAYESVKSAAKNGITRGIEKYRYEIIDDGIHPPTSATIIERTFEPQGLIKRADIAMILYNLLEYP